MIRVAAIGTRRPTLDEQIFCREVGAAIAKFGGLVVSGAAPGCDQAFLGGAYQANGLVEIHLPWPSFESEFVTQLLHARVLYQPELRDMETARGLYFRYRQTHLPSNLVYLMARNVGIIQNADCVIALPDLKTGGTKFGMDIADYFKIPVLNLRENKYYNTFLGDVYHKQLSLGANT